MSDIPRTIPHGYFGSMELDETNRKYRATLEVSPGYEVAVTIDWAGMAPSEALMRSRDICDRIRIREPEYRVKVAYSLLSLYNDTWCAGVALDIDGFMNRISLSDVQICPAEFGTESCAILCYADGDLFAGHYIEVFLDADFDYLKSQLAG